MAVKQRQGLYYVACTFTTVRSVDDDFAPWPASQAHAKMMGGTTTACGRSALTMSKSFDLPFPLPVGDNCRECVNVVIHGEASANEE